MIFQLFDLSSHAKHVISSRLINAQRVEHCYSHSYSIQDTFMKEPLRFPTLQSDHNENLKRLANQAFISLYIAATPFRNLSQLKQRLHGQ